MSQFMRFFLKHRRLVILFGVIVAVTLGGAWSYRWHQREKADPIIEEKRLSVWLTELGPNDWRAASIVRHQDTNCLPLLLNFIGNKDSKWGWFWYRTKVCLRVEDGFQGTASVRRRSSAVMGFWALGERAVDAIGPLEQLLRSDTDLSEDVVQALVGIGTNSIPVLLHAAEDSPLPARLQAINGLRRFEREAQRIRPTLVKLLSDQDLKVRAEAGMAIGFMPIGDNPPIAQLIANLSCPDREVRFASLWTLGQCNTNALAALPAVEKLLTGSDRLITSLARSTRSRILGEPITNGTPMSIFALPPPDKAPKR